MKVNLTLDAKIQLSGLSIDFDHDRLSVSGYSRVCIPGTDVEITQNYFRDVLISIVHLPDLMEQLSKDKMWSTLTDDEDNDDDIPF
jgi:hypothetical protein